MAQPYDLTVYEAAGEIAARTLSPLELTRSLLERYSEVEPVVQAWQTLDPDRALEAARASERQLGTLEPRSLEGVPFGIKDIILTRGLRTTANFPPFNDYVPDYDAEAVARLRLEGATVMGKTVTTQFAFADPPKTRNPWNRNRTPGGSSSGSAAAVAARMVPAALGTQTTGSVLRPAAYCGVVGFKPTFGRISRHGIFPLGWSLDHVGVICRSVEDAALIYDALAGFDDRDPGSADRDDPPVFDHVMERPDAPTLGIVRDFLDRADPDVRAHVERVAAMLERAGAQIREVRLPESMDTMIAVQALTQQIEATTVHGHLIHEQPDGYAPVLRAYLQAGALAPAGAYLHAQRLRRRFREKMWDIVDHTDALLTPTATDTAPDPSTTGNRTMQALWSLLGLPAITLPSGLSGEGLPLAVQLAAAPFQETRLLSAARWVQSLLDPMPAPPLA